MFANIRIVRIVALTDLVLAVAVSCYFGFQIASQGAELIPGPVHASDKVTRLVVYSILLYIFLGIQLFMAIQLMKTTGLIIEEPMKAVRKIGIWLEWSFVYLIFIALHGATALLLMKPGQRRKSIILVICSIQVLFRLIGIMLTNKYQYYIPELMPSKV